MSKSIISNDKMCFICGFPQVHKHHIYGGTSNRRQSEKYGCWLYLCPKHHNMSNEGVHFDRELDLKLKKYCQSRWEEKYGVRAEFIQTFGKSYL